MKIKMKNYIFLSITVFVVFLFVCLSVLVPKLRAGSDDKIRGWAWSENVGWISFNCTTGSTVGGSSCGDSNYGVTYSQIGSSDVYNVTGYAWSDNIGWIKFGGLSNFPAGGADATLTLSGSTASLSGFGRACVVFNSGCSGTLKDNNLRGGWDGWISLSGTGYGVNFNANTGDPLGNSLDILNRFAWGSEVIGWVDFSGVQIDPLVVPPVASVGLDGPSCVPSSSPTAQLTWTTTGVSSCSLLKDGVFYSNISPLDSGMMGVPVSTPQSIFTLDCLTSGSPPVSVEDSVTIESLLSCVPTPANKRPGFIER